MHKPFALLHKLKDGRSQSGQALADEIGVTRSAVWQQIKQLQDMGIDIHAVSGKGYRLPNGYEFLNGAILSSDWPPEIASKIAQIDIEEIVDSTNERLLSASATEDVHGRVLLAEYQTAGRGRRGASWLAPPGSGLCLSMAWRFQETPTAIGALSLVIGLAIQRALLRLGANGVGVKWPNDLYIEDESGPAKIAGILIEMRSELAGPALVVIGLGLNVILTEAQRAAIDQQASDLASVCDEVPSRNATAGAVVEEIVTALETFGESGFAPFRQQWQAADFLKGRTIKLHINSTAVAGVAQGVDDNGLLRLKVGGEEQSHFAGHVELIS